MKHDMPYPIPFQVLKMGPAAARVLARSGQGHVIAVFNRCFYCEINGKFICIGSSSLSMCSLNVSTTIPEGDMRIFPGLLTGMPVKIFDGYVRIGGKRFLLKTEGAGVWLPPSASKPDPERLKCGLTTLEKVAVPQLPEDGLGRFVDRDLFLTSEAKPVLTLAAEPLKHLRGWLRRALADPLNIPEADISSWQALLGLGPGLTPSGDDLVGGIMLGLHSLGHFPILKTLSSALTQVLAERTNPISAAHLRGAMAGTGSEIAHTALNAILSGNQEEISQLTTDIKKFGHTSGWDMLAGIVIFFRLWLESAEACQCAA